VEFLDTAIGFASVVLLLSIGVTALAQATASLLRLRGRNLRRGVEALLLEGIREAQEPGSGAPIGLVVIHGVGCQRKGATRQSVLSGLRSGHPEAGLTSEGDLVLKGRRVRVYEVLWAPILSGSAVWGTFSLRDVLELVWFPRLNHRKFSGLREHREIFGRAQVLWWTWWLSVVGFAFGAAYLGVQALPRALAVITRRLGVFPALQQAPEHLDRVLSDWFGDVLNYVRSSVGAPTQVPDAADRIYDCVHDTLRRAAAECGEIQIVAHSLGSVIAYHAVTRFADRTSRVVALGQSGDGRPRLTRLYTIGSPLAKVLFFWPKVLPKHERRRMSPDIVWTNFRSRLDLVSGRLGTVFVHPIDDRTISGAGGLLTAHVGYRGHPVFVHCLGSGLFGSRARHLPSRAHLWLRAPFGLVETVIANAVLVVFAAIGSVLLFAVGFAAAFVAIGLAEDPELMPHRMLLSLSTGGFVLLVAGILRPWFLQPDEELHRAVWGVPPPDGST
jgi:pimeloyl-ACP methyl ester carboxylesterase